MNKASYITAVGLLWSVDLLFVPQPAWTWTEGTHLKVCVPSQSDVSVSFNFIYTGYISLAIVFSMMIHVVEQLCLNNSADKKQQQHWFSTVFLAVPHTRPGWSNHKWTTVSTGWHSITPIIFRGGLGHMWLHSLSSQRGTTLLADYNTRD